MKKFLLLFPGLLLVGCQAPADSDNYPTDGAPMPVEDHSELMKMEAEMREAVEMQAPMSAIEMQMLAEDAAMPEDAQMPAGEEGSTEPAMDFSDPAFENAVNQAGMDEAAPENPLETNMSDPATPAVEDYLEAAEQAQIQLESLLDSEN